ncbi:hypothetical protein H7I95_16055 [Mycolicibacterium elephantis]|nr:hypothetical protein [Mycolicibacterium elephantis]MCV7222420.1 hypothetical protein [Mycolicibacterium elephantis]
MSLRSNGFPQALGELKQQFAHLASEIPEGAEKKALSVLHGIVMGCGAASGVTVRQPPAWPPQ